MTLLEEMEQFAETNGVPIMQAEGLAFMCDFIQQHEIIRILEIGSAIGYSAIRMAMVDPRIHVVTIERDENRYQQAVDYISRSGLSDRITLVFGDALQQSIEGMFNMLFIDAAKAQYTRFFERYEGNLKQGGYVITDNLKFHGLVEHKELAKSRNLRRLVEKIGMFVEYLKKRQDFETEFLDLGDGVGISRKK